MIAAVFPFGYPFASPFYLTLYVLTLALHFVFMHYVVAGTAFVLVRGLAFRNPNTPAGRLDDTLRDWLPFALSAAITAGVAPLLFLQVLYPRHFYSANLLLFHRWMAIVPVLIAGFYALYLLKTSRRVLESRLWRPLIALFAFACVAFTGYTWVENHQLSLREEVWPDKYASGILWFRHPSILPRAFGWLFSTLPTLSLLLGWQLWMRRSLVTSSASAYRLMSGLALAGAALAGICWWIYAATDNQIAQSISSTSGPYALMALVGYLLVVTIWSRIGWTGRWSVPRGVLASLGTVTYILGILVVRECVRLDSLSSSSSQIAKGMAFSPEGFGVFVFFLLLNGVIIGWCIRLVARSNPIAAADSNP